MTCDIPSSFLSCDGHCVLTDDNIDHCGGCGVACGDGEVCGRGTCQPTDGDGSSCASPIVIPQLDEDMQIQFWLDGSSGSFITSCGALEPRPARFFRWTPPSSSDTHVRLHVNGDPVSDDVVMEVFDGAACTSSLGCNDNDNGLLPNLDVVLTQGHPYIIVVTSRSASPPQGRLELEIAE